MENELLNVKQAAGYLKISTSKLYKMCMKNEIQYYKVGSLNRFKPADLNQFVDSCKSYSEPVKPLENTFKLPRV